MKSNEELKMKFNEFFNVPVEAEAPVSQSIDVLQPKKMLGDSGISEEEFKELQYNKSQFSGEF
jgi:hypothetical protein